MLTCVEENSERPHLKLRAEIFVAREHLRAAVLHGAAEGGEDDVLAEHRRRAEVDELAAEILVDDHVLVLQIAVDDVVLVEVVHSADDLNGAVSRACGA